MEVIIGVRDANRELTVDTDLSKEELLALVEQCSAQGTPLSLSDAQRSIIIPASTIAYIEIPTAANHPVGFGFVK